MIGGKVAKYFLVKEEEVVGEEEVKLFVGEVKYIHKDEKGKLLFHILYEDKDEEDLYEGEFYDCKKRYDCRISNSSKTEDEEEEGKGKDGKSDDIGAGLERVNTMDSAKRIRLCDDSAEYASKKTIPEVRYEETTASFKDTSNLSFQRFSAVEGSREGSKPISVLRWIELVTEYDELADNFIDILKVGTFHGTDRF